MRERRILTLIAVSALAAMALTGCSETSAFPDLEREAGSRDVLSEGFAEAYADSLEHIDPESVRLAASDGEFDLYLMRMLDGGLCLEIRGPERGSMLSCTGGNGPLGASSPAGSYELRPAPIPEEDGWRILSDNLRVRETASERTSPTEPDSPPWESTPRAVDDSGARPGATGSVTGEGTAEMTYIVTEGDTASEIAARFGVGLEQLIDEEGKRLGDYPTLGVGESIQFGAPLAGDDYDCFFGLAEPTAKGESCYE